jgi:Zn-finger nucleic acid-binding protein
MPDRRRVECPVCLGLRLVAIHVADGSALEIDHCWGCGGVWFDHGEADELRRLGTPRELRDKVPLLRGRQRMACRGCEARIHRAAAECEGCGHKNVIDCPVCDRPMERESSTGLRLDICRTCRGAWFDNDQLRAIWLTQLPAAAAPIQKPDGSGGWDIPSVDLETAVDSVNVVVHGAAGAFDGVVWLIDAGGDAAGAVFEVVGSILELLFGIFEGL